MSFQEAVPDDKRVTGSPLYSAAEREEVPLSTDTQTAKGLTRGSSVADASTCSRRKAAMSTYGSTGKHCVSPTVHGMKFDTAHRKKAVPYIFENVNQDVLMKLFQKTGDLKAEERAKSIYAYGQDQEEMSKALMALRQRKKDKFLQIAGFARQSLKPH
ncbi:hypothetical protein AAFF_G00132040 [Aldrovandia affinis]|uniref:Arginine vasopressin-induced protein 1/transcriptional and immune response regulator domain-containing protein n=1 Tax=Aldrovandia affinis TaxID=143900 RepID=A0AAD7RQT2_9TELE|nr:hypothetical protein AAFF_G00132040 [Aldrovandia affinis]